MKIETKYSIGDKVFRLDLKHEIAEIPCDVCNNTKKVELKGAIFPCPNCRNGLNRYLDRWFTHTTSTTIGQVRIEWSLATKHNCNIINEEEVTGGNENINEQYMLAATGIGSGTLWRGKDLFLTLLEAQNEANKRNDLIIEQENGEPK